MLIAKKDLMEIKVGRYKEFILDKILKNFKDGDVMIRQLSNVKLLKRPLDRKFVINIVNKILPDYFEFILEHA